MNPKARDNLLTVLCGAVCVASLSCPTVPRPVPARVDLSTPTARHGAAAPSSGPRALGEIRESLRLGAQYLLGSIGPDGKFVYRINLDPSVKVRASYNVLRHAGTMYALASYHQRWPSTETATALAKTAGFLEGYMGPLPERDDLIAVWENKHKKEAKLGGAGLTLLALVAREHAVPGTANVAELSRVGSFVTFMQKPDGDFYSKYFRDKGGKSDAWRSLYYPGEAALGLLVLHELAPSSGWLDAAVRALGHLADERRGRARVEPDHWALIATGRLFTEYGHTDWPRDKGLLKTHALQICESVLAAEQDLDPSSPMYGAFDTDGRTTPAATRLEGLLAALPLLEDTYDADLKKRARTAIDAGIRFLIRAQIKEGAYAGAVPRALRASDDRASEVRIDYVQHAMSAWMAYLDLLETEASP